MSLHEGIKIHFMLSSSKLHNSIALKGRIYNNSYIPDARIPHDITLAQKLIDLTQQLETTTK